MALVLSLVAAVASSAQSKRPITIDDLMKLKAVESPRVSPDGKWIAFTVTEMDLKEDKSETRIWMVPATGGDAIPMTSKGYSAESPRWSPDGKYLAFIASRGKDKDGDEEKPQVFTLNRLGGEAQQVTNVKQGVGGFEWSPDSSCLLLSIRDPKPEELTEDK
ncbi:MAG TPA: hypothetical protein PKO33_11650, partial [Pyrinomonadaceae bacterium]|nr:hypothetical protein [Pyrinomonadaceae bacterium]